MDAEEPVGEGAAAIFFYAFVASLWHLDSCLNLRGNAIPACERKPQTVSIEVAVTFTLLTFEFLETIIMETTQTMNAIRSHHRGGPETLIYEPVARPMPHSGEVLVEVHAAAITPTELTWDPTWTDEQGKSRLPIIPSHEISGVVAKVETDALNIAAGDEVYGLIDFFRNGAAAEFAIARVAELAPKPRSVDHLHAAAIPLSALTAWQAFRPRRFSARASVS